MTETLLTSASQIKLYRECVRKFGWSYLAKIKSPPNAAAQLGIEVDDTQLQPYLRDGRPFDYTRESGYIAAAGLAYLPEPKSPGLEVQKHFVMPSPTWETAPQSYQGYMDLYLPDSSAMPQCEGGVPLVGDFKTTSDFRWALTPKTLASDVQAQLYAMQTLVSTGAHAVDLVWIYFRTRGAKAVKRVHLRVSPDQVGEQFERINDTAVEAFNVRKAFAASGQTAEEFTLKELQPNASMCDAYGGCPYRSKCNLSPAQIATSLADNLKRIVTRLPPIEDLTMNTTSTIDLLASLKARNGLSAPVVTQPSTPEENPMKVALGINPPEAKLPPAPFHPPTTLQEPVVELAKPKRGRPAGSKNVLKDPAGPDEVLHTAPVVVDAFEAAIEKQIGEDSNRNAKIGALVVELVALIKGAA